MKWKTGAALMIVVLIIAMIPAAWSVLRGGEAPVFTPKKDEHQLVLQIDNNNAIRDGEVVSIDDGKGTAIAPYIDASGNMLVPLRFLAESLGAELAYADGTFQLTIGDQGISLSETASSVTGVDGKSYTLPVAPTRVGNSFFVPGRAITEALGGFITYYPPVQGGYVICSIGMKEAPSEQDIAKVSTDAQDKLGYSVQQYLSDCLVVRDGSNSVQMNGETVKLESGEKAKLDGDTLYFPADSVSEITKGAIVYEDSVLKQEGKKLNVAVKEIDGSAYIALSEFAQALGKHYVAASENTMGVLTGYPLEGHQMQIDTIVLQASGLPSLGNIPEADAYIALTFDDGPTGGSEGLTARLLNALKERDAHATFFMCGYRIKDFHTHMDRYLAEGHELGNHTMDHEGLLTKRSNSSIHQQVDDNSDLIESYTGQKPTVMRPVGGAYNDTVKQAMQESGLPIINWSIDTLDWKNRDADKIYANIVNNAQDGDIVLMHDLRQCTLDGTVRAIDTLKERGFAFVTVSELAAIKGVEMQAGEVYTDFRDSTVAKLNGGAADGDAA